MPIRKLSEFHDRLHPARLQRGGPDLRDPDGPAGPPSDAERGQTGPADDPDDDGDLLCVPRA